MSRSWSKRNRTQSYQNKRRKQQTKTHKTRKKNSKTRLRHPKDLADVLYSNYKDLINQKTIRLDDSRCLIIGNFEFGYIIECETMDEKDLLERETFFSRDGKLWTLLGRHRQGPFHHNDKWYPRDNHYPVGCKVRI